LANPGHAHPSFTARDADRQNERYITVSEAYQYSTRFLDPMAVLVMKVDQLLSVQKVDQLAVSAVADGQNGLSNCIRPWVCHVHIPEEFIDIDFKRR
jgi:hypothetical protein